jgi:hypothetical protein
LATALAMDGFSATQRTFVTIFEPCLALPFHVDLLQRLAGDVGQ